MKRGRKEKYVLGTCCVQGAPPPTRDLVIERVSTVPKEIDLKDRIATKGVCACLLFVSYVAHLCQASYI